ncbi:MAG: efflux RND transporter periplasmic adaptor subunit [Gammaproteobacteria bacterium]|nr:MAG: efflux RND transporter periplasmic adaptor subunit [Gammaproteobacteria bacterium]
MRITGLLLGLTLSFTAAAATPVTVTQAASETLAVTESAVGTIEALYAPTVAAEVAARVVAVEVEEGEEVRKGQLLASLDPEDYRLAVSAARASLERIEALIHGQQLKVDRLLALRRKQSASQSALDEAESALKALRAERALARVRLAQAERRLSQTRILSPVEGRVSARMVSPGDYVKAGTPLFRLTGRRHLRARLPFPETLAGRLRPGQAMRLVTPQALEQAVETTVGSLRPEITPSNRAIEALVQFDNPDGWEPGASVTGTVTLEVHEGAVTVPEAALVRRPAGEVVYVIEGDSARQRLVHSGLRLRGKVEITAGLAAGETVAVDGAGFLTDGARVEVRSP